MMNNIISYLENRWGELGGYKEFLSISIPLILSTSSGFVQQFINRMFLAWHSPEAIAAVTPVSILYFTILYLFLYTSAYVSTFIAQYFGAKEFKKIGPIIWQGVYISVIAGIIYLVLMFYAKNIFNFIGHSKIIREYEIIYFQFLCLSVMPYVGSSALSGFFSGRGKTRVIMWITISSTLIGIMIDYTLILGHWGFPILGIKGAGISTIISACFSFAIYVYLILKSTNNTIFNTRNGWRINFFFIRRLVKFGLPNGIHKFLAISGTTFFILLIGRLGTINLAASNITLTIYLIVFLPMIGIGTATSVKVGQYLAMKKPDLAEYITYSGFHLTFLYVLVISILYLLVPKFFIAPFAAQTISAQFDEIYPIVIKLLYFVAFYSFFDAMNVIFSSAVKGAGDTKYVMLIMIICSTFLLIPMYISISIFNLGLYFGWLLITVYIIFQGLTFFFRFYHGKWKMMLVIEK